MRRQAATKNHRCTDETTSHSTKHDKAVQVAGYASVDVKRVGPAPGEPDQLYGEKQNPTND